MATPAQHVPAWKRLGLKLKHAPDVAPIADTPKRKRVPEEKDTAQVKKTKTNAAASAATLPTTLLPTVDSNHSSAKKSKKENPDKKTSKAADSVLDATVTTQLTQPLSTPRLTRQKSVTFTPETKQADGDSIKQLFNLWVAEQKAKDPNFELATSQPAFDEPEPRRVEEKVDTSLTEKEQRIERVKAKKVKKEKRKKEAESRKPELDPALAYLDQFCNSRDTWKFNKIHQINLIKNFYSEKSIPSTQIEQFYSYVQDLKGQGRTLLRDSALKVKVTDQEEGKKGFSKFSDPEKAYSEYEVALSKYVTAMSTSKSHPTKGYEEGVLMDLSDSSMKPRVIRRMRAERIIADLAADAGEVARQQPEAASEKKVNPVTGKVVRKRKQRTAIEISDSSSGDSESDSSDSSDSDEDEEKPKGKGKRGNAAEVKKQVTTSDTDSSLDSDSDGDTSSGSGSD